MNEIVVVANRAPEPLSRIGNSVTVLDQQAISASQLIAASDLLQTTPGLTVSRDGGVGQLTTVFIRGADSDETMVVIDGVRMYDPSAPGAGYNFANLLTSDVARIEILRGAQSTLYGSQAMGGVINIVTAEPTSPLGGGITAEGGSHDTGYVTSNVGGKNEDWMWRVLGFWYGTSGIPAFDEVYGGTRLCASQIGGGTGLLRYEFTPDLQLDLRGYDRRRALTSTASTHSRETSAMTTSTARTTRSSATPASSASRPTARSSIGSRFSTRTRIPAITIRTRRPTMAAPPPRPSTESAPTSAKSTRARGS